MGPALDVERCRGGVLPSVGSEGFSVGPQKWERVRAACISKNVIRALGGLGDQWLMLAQTSLSHAQRLVVAVTRNKIRERRDIRYSESPCVLGSCSLGPSATLHQTTCTYGLVLKGALPGARAKRDAVRA